MASDSLLSAATEDAIRDAQRKIPADLFPLPLSPFEKFILWDETLAHPMVSYVELHFDSALDHQRLELALAFAVHYHPLLASRVVELKGQLYWQYDPGFRPKIHFETEVTPLSNSRPRPIDLMSDCGLIVWHRPDERGARVLIQLHHACCDGIGLRRVVIDWFNYYAHGYSASASGPVTAATAGTAASHAVATTSVARPQLSWERLEPAVLKERANFKGAFSEQPSRPLSTWQRIQNAYYFHFQPPQPLLTPKRQTTTQADADDLEPLRHSIIEREKSQAIFECCRVQEIGTNELGLALLFRACAQWNRQQGAGRGDARLRLLMPYQLLSRIDLRMPAANRLSFSFLGRTHAQCQDLNVLLDGLRAEIELLRETHLPLDFLNGLTAACKVPLLMKWVLKRSRRMCTAVLTYTGDVSRGFGRYFPEVDGARVMGDARLKNAFVAPPVRAQTNVSLGLCVNWGQLCISAAWNRDALTGSECQEFIDIYRNAWLEWLQGQSQ